ncbi:hypothetical protein EON81_29680 [bacterium]|nr:MAG: hypothetical protein EON81_29680 [bacterium]
MIYTNDYDDANVEWEYGHVPNDTNPNYTPWPCLITPYTKNTDIFFDPSRSRTVKVQGDPMQNVGGWGWQVHMAINRAAFATDGDRVRTMTSFPSIAERVAFAYGEQQYNFGTGHWFDNNKAACPSLANTATTNDQDWYNMIGRSAVKNHGDGIISAFADGHAKKMPYKKVQRNNATFTDSETCEKEVFGGPDKIYVTADDPDTEVTRYWGRFWDASY